MKREHGQSLGFYTIGIAMLFLAGFLLLVIFGAHSYRNTASAQNGNMQERAVSAYIFTTIKGYDARDAVRLEDSAYGQMLVIADGSTGYGLKIYCSQGELVEEYAALDAALSPEDAHVIGKTTRFDVFLDGDRLAVDTDAGSVLLRLRSEGGGA